MICMACRRAADHQATLELEAMDPATFQEELVILAALHAECPGETHCPCQHKMWVLFSE